MNPSRRAPSTAPQYRGPPTIGTLFRPASKRYDDTRDGGVQRLVDTYMIMCSTAHPVDKAWVRATAELSWDRDHAPGATGRQLAASRTAGDIRAQLRQLRTPTLVIHGEDDPWIRPRAARELAAAVPDARLITYPGMGHEFPEHLWSAIARDVWETITRDAASYARAAPRP